MRWVLPAIGAFALLVSCERTPARQQPGEDRTLLPSGPPAHVELVRAARQSLAEDRTRLLQLSPATLAGVCQTEAVLSELSAAPSSSGFGPTVAAAFFVQSESGERFISFAAVVPSRQISRVLLIPYQGEQQTETIRAEVRQVTLDGEYYRLHVLRVNAASETQVSAAFEWTVSGGYSGAIELRDVPPLAGGALAIEDGEGRRSNFVPIVVQRAASK